MENNKSIEMDKNGVPGTKLYDYSGSRRKFRGDTGGDGKLDTTWRNAKLYQFEIIDCFPNNSQPGFSFWSQSKSFHWNFKNKDVRNLMKSNG